MGLRIRQEKALQDVELYLEQDKSTGEIYVKASPPGGIDCYLLGISGGGVRRIRGVGAVCQVELDSVGRVKDVS